MLTSPFDNWVVALSKPIDHFGRTLKIRSGEEIKDGSKRLYVLMPPWHSDFDFYRVIRKKIEKAGDSWVQYDIRSSLLSLDYKVTNEQFAGIRERVISDIRDLKGKHGFKEAVIIGVSIGCVETFMIANGNPDITRMILVAPGNCLAESMWKGLRTANIRKMFERQGVTLEELKVEWKRLSPEQNIDGLQGKQIEVQLSKSDKVIPYELGRNLVSAMRSAGLRPKVTVNSYLGHYGTALLFCLFPKSIL